MYTICSRTYGMQGLTQFPGAELRDEPMFHKASLDFAYDNGGPVTTAFIDKLASLNDGENYADGVLDTRVHMLMKGWYPCIPGWHHDDVERTRQDGQPNYDNQTYRSKSVVAIVGDDVARTEFACGTADFAPVPLGDHVYGQWTREVDDYVAVGLLERWKMPTNSMVFMDDHTWHRGTPATGSGWRWFARLTYDTARVPVNEIRHQTQVYLPDVEAGW